MYVRVVLLCPYLCAFLVSHLFHLFCQVNMALGAIETEIRKEQHGAEKKWKQTGRSTKSDLKNVRILHGLLAAAVFPLVSRVFFTCSIRSTWLWVRSRLTFARSSMEPKSNGRKLDAAQRVTLNMYVLCMP